MVPVRAEERDAWARLEKFVNHYKLAWAFWLVMSGVGTWIGLNIIQPLQSVRPLQAQVARQDTAMKANFDTVKARLDTADVVRNEMAQVLKVFGKFICRQMTAAERYNYDVRCRDLPPPQPLNGAAP